ncbi:serine/threonine-protein kinase [Streptomyces sp. NPDC012888]|uniref:serine/threonine-protein kinase n=1 Tax=Streptomyces sp. NPDC012888 TaxID=3364855 RepID=UPI0036B61AFF
MLPLEAADPRAVGAYRLLGRLGAGGMGRVYLGRSAGGRTVAVKVVHPHFASDDEFRARFRREVDAARRVGGEWTAPVLDADPDAAVPWVATGYVAGPSLDRAVAAHGPLPERTVRAVGLGLARALVAVHGLGLVHRDVKPSNVLLALEGPRLIDFGIARATEGTASLTSTGVSVGSPGYMAPEQILGKGVTGAADVFSLGAVLAFAATGRPPFSGDNSATLLYKVVHEEPDLDELPPGPLRELVAACLSKAPAGRPAPAAVADVLDGALGASGWLPAPLVEDASRAAVRLLDLDAADGPVPGPAGPDSGPLPGHGPGPGPLSGPIPFTEPSSGGGFGPADPSYGHLPTQTSGGGTGSAGPYGPPAPAGAGTAPAGVREVSVRAAGRRLSCAVVLSAAAAVAVLAGGLYWAELLPGTGGRARDLADGGPSGGGRTSSATPPAASEPTASASPSGKARDEVPKAFVGTWKGTVTTGRLGVAGEFEITIRGGRTGQVVARDRSVLPVLGTDCSGDWKLLSATDTSLVLDTSGGPNPAPGICSGGSANERFTLNANGTLHYESGDVPAGNPRGDLTRSP